MALELTVMSLDFEADEATKVERYAKGELKVGRGSLNDLVLTGSAVSTDHAIISVDTSGPEPKILVTDLGSTNGTLVDNKKIAPHTPTLLKENQRILIGEYLIKPSLILEFASQAAQSDGINEDEAVEKNSSEYNPDIQLVTGGKIIGAKSEENTDWKTNSESDPIVLDDNDAIESDNSAFLEPEATRVHPGFFPSVDATEEEHESEDSIEPLYAYEDSETHAEEDSPAIEEPDSHAEEQLETEQVGNTQEHVETASPTQSGLLSGVVGPDMPALTWNAKKLLTLKGVVRHNGQGLVGVRVDAGDLGETETTSSGEFFLKDLVEGTPFELTLDKDEFIIDGQSFTGSVEEGEELFFEARQLFNIRGQIVRNGTPIPGVEVDGGCLGSTITDDNGYYEFTDVPEGTEFALSAKKDGFVFE